MADSGDLTGSDAFVLAVDGFEGPIDLLLNLAREQKVDLLQISILALAEQYLVFVEKARAAQLELAADYLVMAAWLAYLKSRLLAPDAPGDEDEPNAEELAEALARRLRHLEAMQRVGGKLMARLRLGVDLFDRGAPEGVVAAARPVYDLGLLDLMRAYAAIRLDDRQLALHIDATELHSVEEALRRLSAMLDETPGWSALRRFLPTDAPPGLARRSALAATFAATLELAKAGRIELRQDQAFGPIYLRRGGGAA